MDKSSSSGVADSASYSAEYGATNTSVTRMGGRRYRRRSSRAGQMMSDRVRSRAGGRRHKMRKTRRVKKTHRRRS
jgi:hypothetical protein